jgi:hypothetical protein
LEWVVGVLARQLDIEMQIPIGIEPLLGVSVRLGEDPPKEIEQIRLKEAVE